ncbi:MAG: repeat-containing protein [Acidobacteriaceae bacterium]|jgi:tetratricopeptide (TPR) repeat protein|nr:repeat-containing protein [Acidobacteriaceae bacterium]
MTSAFPRPYIPVSQLLTAILQLAAEHHRAGRQAAAATLYREVLELDPRNADALFLLGVMERQMGRPEEARRRLLEAARWTASRVPVEAELRIVERMLAERSPLGLTRRPVQGWLERTAGYAGDCGVVAVARA